MQRKSLSLLGNPMDGSFSIQYWLFLMKIDHSVFSIGYFRWILIIQYSTLDISDGY